MSYYFRVFLIGLALLGLIVFLCLHSRLAYPNVDFPVAVNFPKQYTWADGSVLPPDQFQGTKILYGTCDENTEIGELLGEVMAPSTSNSTGTFYVPSGQILCFVAVVVDLDGQPLGKSYVVKFSTKGVVPKSPVNIFAG